MLTFQSLSKDSKVGITLLHDCTLYHRKLMFGSLHFSGQILGLVYTIKVFCTVFPHYNIPCFDVVQIFPN